MVVVVMVVAVVVVMIADIVTAMVALMMMMAGVIMGILIGTKYSQAEEGEGKVLAEGSRSDSLT